MNIYFNGEQMPSIYNYKAKEKRVVSIDEDGKERVYLSAKVAKDRLGYSINHNLKNGSSDRLGRTWRQWDPEIDGVEK